MNFELAGIGLNAIRRVTDLWAAGKADSLIDYTRVARVEPLCIIDADCLYLDAIGQVQQSMLSVFSGYYLQAIALSATVGKVEVVKQLDRMNPNRSPSDSALNTLGTGSYAGGLISAVESLQEEAYQYRLPVPGDTGRAALEQMALEATTPEDRAAAQARRDAKRQKNDDARTRQGELKIRADNAKFDFDVKNVYAQREMKDKEFAQQTAEAQRKYELDVKKMGADEAYRKLQHDLAARGLALKEAEHKGSEFGIGRDTLSTIRELADLSVGKLLSVEITDGLHKASIPVSIRLIANSLPSTSLVHILSQGSEDTSVKERWHGWRSGRLSFMRDLVLCQDLIDAHKKNLMADKDGMFATILRRNRNNQLATIMSGNPSVATASNLCVMSNTTAAELELKINGKLKDFHIREKIFKKTYMMIMAVIDKQWERVTFYHRGIATPTEVGVRDLRASNKGSGPDVSDILRAYTLGQSPSL
jgi:hypothetical protein